MLPAAPQRGSMSKNTQNVESTHSIKFDTNKQTKIRLCICHVLVPTLGVGVTESLASPLSRSDVILFIAGQPGVYRGPQGVNSNDSRFSVSVWIRQDLTAYLDDSILLVKL